MRVGVTTQAEMSALTQLLDKDYFNVEWFDVRTQTTVTAQYYASDYDVDLLSKSRGLYNPLRFRLFLAKKEVFIMIPVSNTFKAAMKAPMKRASC